MASPAECQARPLIPTSLADQVPADRIPPLLAATSTTARTPAISRGAPLPLQRPGHRPKHTTAPILSPRPPRDMAQ